MIYKTCPRCGANIDPGERCDCDREQPELEVARRHVPRRAAPDREIPYSQDAYVPRPWRSCYEQ